MRSYQGYDIIYSEDEYGYYVQDFSNPKQPTSQVFNTVDELKKAIDSNKIIWK